jgi:electron transport complex protein RnfA
MNLFLIMMGAILINNYVLAQFLGMCPFFGVSKNTETALGMGISVTFVMVLASVMTWLFNFYILSPYNLTYLNTLVFVLIIAAIVQFLEVFMKKNFPGLHAMLGVYLPLITTNCAVLGAVLINAVNGSGFIESVFFAFCSGLGFTLALLLFSSVRARLEFSEHPESFEGFPIALVTAGLLALAFTGFAGTNIS